MGFTHGAPMPHSPGCPGGHHRGRDNMCEAFRAEINTRNQRRTSRYRGDCERCGGEDRKLVSHAGEKMCKTCYSRWWYRGFTGTGPGPEFCTEAEQAIEHQEIITQLSLAQAAQRLGVDRRTISRWRKALKKETGLTCTTP